LWELVGKDEDLYFVDLVLRYARRVRGADRTTLRQLAAPYLTQVATRAQGADVERRARAVQTLGELGLPAHADTVVAALDDASPLVAMIAARALARKETPQYADAVLARLHRFTSWRPSFLASMLSSMGPEVGSVLRRTLGNSSIDPEVRAIAATALRHLHDLDSAPVAAEVLNSEKQRDLLASCLRLLGTVGGPRDLPTVRRLMDSPDFVVRATAVGALGSLGEQSDLARLRQIAVDDESHWVAINAARALREAGDVEVLRKLASSGHDRASVAVQVLAEVQE
jgi:HEAT repeat protein